MSMERKLLRGIARKRMEKSGIKHINKRYHRDEFPIKIPFGVSFFSRVWRFYL